MNSSIFVRIILAASLLILPVRVINSQIIINEFMASNLITIADPESGAYSDWIELYNTSNSDINLNGYFLTDNLHNPVKYEITGSIHIPAGGYILIWADDDSSGVHTSFKLAQEGEEIGLFSPQGQVIDTLTYTAQFADISYGRQTDGSANWGFFLEPTPGTSNNTTAYTGVVDNVPEFSLFGGIFSSPQQVSLSTPFGGTIRYTTDGSDPASTSPAYTVPISINNTTILRARIFKPGLIPGRIITNSYFVDESLQDRGLPVFSIATNPGNFWDPEIGIYVQDFKPEWEVPINIEFFENDGSDRAAFNESAGTKVNGLYSWQLPQKMLGIYFRKQYGTSRVAYPLIFDRNRAGYETFALRASGNDWSNTLFRDAMIHTSTPYNMNIDIMGYRPSILYVNGQYMGIHNIREKIEENYVVEHYGLEEGSFDMVEYEEFAEAGDLTAYNTFKNLYSRDLSIQSNYDAVASAMDIENFTDYMATELYSGNYSIDHNVMAWKPKNSGKWRWILMDLDRGFFDPFDQLVGFYINQSVWPLYNLMQNQGYRRYFGKRIADHLYTTFNPARIKDLIDQDQQRIEREMPYHIDRWEGTTSSYGDAIPSMEYWYDEVDVMRSFAEARPQIILNDLQSYGFSATAKLVLSVSPSNAGYITLNSLKVPGANCSGPYFMDIPIELTAIDKPGYDFAGWAQSVRSSVIIKDAEWKYLDDGSDQGSTWYDTIFNDNSWQSGFGEFGYGDGGENTIINYGSNENNKHITTYFRKSFQLTTSDLAGSNFMINVLYDDGAVVYLNGQEIFRPNMASGAINYQTLASSSISGIAESEYMNYAVDASYFKAGTNVLAVEVHQSAANSSDLSFDLELIIDKPQSENYVSTSRNYTITLTEARSLVAIYVSTGECIIPEDITSNLTLTKECSPYIAQGDITVDSGATLTIEPGVEIRMAEEGNMFIYGDIQAIGTEIERILFTSIQESDSSRWGAICLINCSDVSNFAYVTIEHASEGPIPIREIAAISAFHSNMNLDHLIIEDVYHDPILGRYSDIVLTNSSLHCEIEGSNLINVKYGHGQIENCTFRGNRYIDSDGIDYDNVEDGVIKNCKIYDILGYNSDAIDIGEIATNVTIDSVLMYNIFDKGISIGQQSTANVKNCIFVNCNLGLGVKDSSTVHINHCTFYGVGKPIACYEKNAGRAGGNAFIRNCILSNSYDSSYLVDERSTWQISYSIADNDNLPENGTNLFGNPEFENPTDFDFSFLTSSPCLASGNDNGEPAQMGSLYRDSIGEPDLMFIYIFTNAGNSPGKSEFLGIYNPSSRSVDLFNYKISRGIEFEFKEPVTIAPLETIFLVKDLVVAPENLFSGRVFQWTSGNLANEGEAIRIVDKYGIVKDQVIYNNELPWPDYSSDSGAVLSLISTDLDNHFPESWKLIDYYDIIHKNQDSTTNEILIYPNPSNAQFFFRSLAYIDKELNIISVTGQLCATIKVDEDGYAVIDLSKFESGIYLIKAGDTIHKIVLLKE